jgi:hypothetical protein
MYPSAKIESDTIYAALAEHQKAADWIHARDAATFLSWTKRMNLEFKLQVTELALKIGDLPVRTVSHFRAGHNEFGLRGEICLNARHFGKQPLAVLLFHLAHELIHAWQHQHGRPSLKDGWHNREFRQKAAELGLQVAENGATTCVEGPLSDLITSCGIALPAVKQTTFGIAPRAATSLAGDSKLKKWVCECIRPVIVRVAIADFRAACLVCNYRFRRADAPNAKDDVADCS